jgi:phosphoglycolate phosphatase-like HAD superfamily hydrolase
LSCSGSSFATGNAVFAAGKDFIVPGRHYKDSAKAQEDVVKFVRNYKGQIYMVGDKKSDYLFAQKIGADVFIKLPDPEYSKKLPEFMSRLVP